MNRTLPCLTGLGLALVALGCQTPASREPSTSEIGRYHFSETQGDVYITDTTTGEVWCRSFRPGSQWQSMGTPVPTTKP